MTDALPRPELSSPQLPRPELPRPQSRTELFIAFTMLALQGFGGVLPLVQREIVERRRWMSQEEFIEEWAVAQTMPGPNVCNLSLVIGSRFFGLPGAAAALLGLLVVPALVVLALGSVYTHYSDHPRVSGALRGMAAVAAGMIAATGIKLAATLHRHPVPLPVTLALAVLGVVGIVVLRLPMLVTLLVLGGAGCVLTWRKLKP